MTTTNEGDKRLLADIAAVEACSVCGGDGYSYTSYCRTTCPACSGTGRRPAVGGPSEALRFGAEIVDTYDGSGNSWSVSVGAYYLTPLIWGEPLSWGRDPQPKAQGRFESRAAALAALNAATPPPGWVEPPIGPSAPPPPGGWNPGVPDALKPGALGEQPAVPESTWTKETQRLAVEPQSANVGTVREVLATTRYVGNEIHNRPETSGERDARERLDIFRALDALGDLQRRIGEAVFEIALEVKHSSGDVSQYAIRKIEEDARRVVAALRKLEREP